MRALFLFLGVCASVIAAETPAYLVYDVTLREFTCWTERNMALPAPVNGKCTGAWRSITGDLYFVRGQSVSVVLANANAIDLFAVELKVDDLPEPTAAILGDFGTLPKMLSIPPAPTLVGATGATFIAGEDRRSPVELFYRFLATAEEKDFKTWLKQNLTDPLSAKEVQDILTTQPALAVKALATQTPALVTEADAIHSALTTNVPAIGSTLNIAQAARWLAVLIERQRALRDRTIVTGLSNYAKQIADAGKALQSSQVRRALDIGAENIGGILAELNTAFPAGSSFSRVEKITVAADTKTYVVTTEPERTEMQEFLKLVNEADGADASDAGLARLRKNIIATLEVLPELALAEKQLEKLEQIQKDLSDYAATADNVFILQEKLDRNAGISIEAARRINEAARTTPLEAEYSVLPVGVWFGSREVAVTLKQGQRFSLFDIGGATDTVRTEVTGAADNPAARAVQSAAADLSTTRSTRVRIFNTYRFQLGLGFVYSAARDDRYQVVSQTTGSGSAAVTQKYIDQTRSRDYNMLATVDVVVFPTLRTNFPWKPRYPGERPRRLQNIGALLGFSLTSPNRDFLVGGATSLARTRND